MESEELVVQTEEDGKLCWVCLLVFWGEDEYFQVANNNITLCPMRLINGFSGQRVCVMQVKFVGVNNFHFTAVFLKGQGSLKRLELTNASPSSY